MTRLICTLLITLVVCWACWHILSTGFVAFVNLDIALMYNLPEWPSVGRFWYAIVGVIWTCFTVPIVDPIVTFIWDEVL